MNMSPREHSRLARELIAACGGLAEAAGACRVAASKLSDYQNAGVTLFMPADVMADLELYCGKPIYSRALFERFDAPVITADLRDSVEELVEDAAALQGEARRALADGSLSPRDLDSLQDAETKAEAALERIRGIRRALEAGTGATPHLKAV